MVRPISEDDQADYRQQDAEERERNRLFRLGQRGGPDAAEPCGHCWGKGRCAVLAQAGKHPAVYNECSRCLGTGVQP